MSVGTTGCARCGVRPVGGRFCRSCGAALGDAPGDVRHPDRPVLRDGNARDSNRDARAGTATKTGPAPRSQQPSRSTSSTASRGQTASDSRTTHAPETAPGAFYEQPESIESGIQGQGPPLAPVAHMPAPPPPGWILIQPQAPARQGSTGLAVTLALAVLLVALAIAVTVILLVANGGPDRAGIVAPSSVTAPTGEGR